MVDSSPLVIGIDVGTTGTKAAVLDDAGQVLARAYHGYEVRRRAGRIAEQDAAEWWEAVVTVVRRCVAEADARRVVALAVSYQGGSLVAVDDSGAPLAPARSWLDRRASRAVTQLQETFGADGLFRRTGWPPFGGYTCAQLLEMRQSDPDLFSAASAFLGTGEFINLLLTGRRVSDLNGAGITQLFDAVAGTWSGEILELAGLSPRRLSELMPSGRPIGTLTDRAAEQLGLPRDVVVASGGHDQYCAALGAGAMEPGDVLLSTGTAWVLLGITAGPRPDPLRRFAFGRHVTEGTWAEFGSLRNGGSCLDWMRTIVGSGAPLPYEAVETAAAAAPPGSGGVRFLPLFDGTAVRAQSTSPGAAVMGIDLGHGPAQLLRSVMEGVAFEARALLDAYESIGDRARTVTLLGGATRSPVWTGIVADVLGVPTRTTSLADAACVGAAALAGAGAGLWADAASAAAALRQPDRPAAPSPAATIYADLYRSYRGDVLALTRPTSEERAS